MLAGTEHGIPLSPGPGAKTVLAEGFPVWRTQQDKHLCPLGPPPHGPQNMVMKGAERTLAENFLIARHDDFVMEMGGAVPVKIVPAPEAAAVAAERAQRIAEAKAKAEGADARQEEADTDARSQAAKSGIAGAAPKKGDRSPVLRDARQYARAGTIPRPATRQTGTKKVATSCKKPMEAMTSCAGPRVGSVQSTRRHGRRTARIREIESWESSIPIPTPI